MRSLMNPYLVDLVSPFVTTAPLHNNYEIYQLHSLLRRYGNCVGYIQCSATHEEKMEKFCHDMSHSTCPRVYCHTTYLTITFRFNFCLFFSPF